jgi:hypothetical protein
MARQVLVNCACGRPAQLLAAIVVTGRQDPNFYWVCWPCNVKVPCAVGTSRPPADNRRVEMVSNRSDR